jgi:nucleoside-diphosphate-sugar epimerase
LNQGEHLVIGDGNFHINPIAREDVAVFIADCIEEKNPPGNEYFLGGPDIFTFSDIGILAAEVMGKKDEIRIIYVSQLFMRMLVMILDLFGLCFRSARHKAALFHWTVYVSSHDAVAPCRGKICLRDEFEKKIKSTEAYQRSDK